LTAAMAEAKKQCPGTNRETGLPCKAPCIKGGTACRRHGGNLPRVKAAAEFRLARDKAQQEALKRLKARGSSKVEIVDEMDRLAAEAIVFKDIARERLDELWAMGEIRYAGKTGEQLRAEVALYERCLTQCNAILSTNIKLGIAERKQKIDEAQALIVVGLIKSVLNRLDLSKDQKRLAAQVVPEELRAISNVIQGEVVPA
jgi:hypothetical protein